MQNTNLLQVLWQGIFQKTHNCKIFPYSLQHWLLKIVVHGFKNLIPSLQALGIWFQWDRHITLEQTSD